jgi:DNA gyrase/topoisomerase IV subunit B
MHTAKKQKLLKDGEGGLLGEHIREGLSAIVSVKVGHANVVPAATQAE